MKRVWLSWSSGKDSAWALHRLRNNNHRYRVTGLFTTIDETSQRVATHGVPRALVETQAIAAGLPLRVVPLPWPCSNDVYEAKLDRIWKEASQDGVEAIAFGDLFLVDIFRYRIALLEGTGLEPLFPLWQRPTMSLAREMIESGLRAKITCVDPEKLGAGFVGREYDSCLLEDLPQEVDPCGERGEFHSFVYAGPMFQSTLRVGLGDIVTRDAFLFADVASPDQGVGEVHGDENHLADCQRN